MGGEITVPHLGAKIPLPHYPLPIVNPQGKPSRNLERNYLLRVSSIVCQCIIISRACTFRVDLFDPFSFFQTNNGFRNILQMFMNLVELFQLPKVQAVGGMLRKSKHLNSLFLHVSFSTNFKAWFSKNWISDSKPVIKNEEGITFFLVGKKREKTPESFTNWFLSGQVKKILCCMKHHFSICQMS